jgi:hypothetical protein
MVRPLLYRDTPTLAAAYPRYAPPPAAAGDPADRPVS